MRLVKNAYVPYSHFPIGAVLVAKDGSVYTGCNIENASYPLTNCGERTAIFKAVSEGQREFSELIVYGQTEKPISPCGACRQVMVEFFKPDLKVTLVAKDKNDGRDDGRGITSIFFYRLAIVCATL